MNRSAIASNLATFERIETPRPELKAASVAVCLVVDDAELSLVITRRAPRLRSHAGQWALPGGRRDGTESAVATARRELCEETGLDVAEADVLGVLDDYVTRSGYVMTPVVVWAGAAAVPLGGAASEVAAVHLARVAELDVDPRLISIAESDRPVIQLPLFGRYVHAPTAAIIYQFCQVGLHGQHVRVADYEQPVFAWK